MDDLFIYIKKTFKKLDNLFLILISGQIFAGLVLFYFVMNKNTVPDDHLIYTLKIFIVSFNIASFISIKLAYKKSCREINASASFEEKVRHYRAINMMRMLLMASSNIINLAVYFLAGTHLFLIVLGLMFLLSVYYRPSRTNFVKEYDLTEIQKNIIIKSH